MAEGSIPYWIGIAVAVLGGGFGRDVIRWLLERRKGIVAERRAEVAKAIAERDKMEVERDSARASVHWYERWTRIIEEGWAKDRRTLINAGLEPVPYPERPSRD